MEYKEFLEVVKEIIEDKTDDSVQVCISTITKNNNVELSGLTFRKNGVNASPTIYMEFYYEQFMAGAELDSISDSIINTYNSCQLQEDFQSDFFLDYDKVKGCLLAKLVNYEKNKRLLEDVPYEKFYDLAIVPYYCMNTEELGTATILVKNEHLNIWKVTKDVVMDDAISNTARLEYKVSPIVDIIGESYPEANLGDCLEGSIPMYVVTNNRRLNGAIFMTMLARLKSISHTLGSDFYIIPSSIHEVILLKCSGCENVSEMNEMVREVNATQLGLEEVLSDHVYLYSEEMEALIF